MLTTSFPRFRGDYAGVFVYELAEALTRQGEEIRVVAPGDGLSARHEVLDGIEIVRFQYMLPRNLQRLAYESGGLTVTLRKSMCAKFQLPLFVASFAESASRWARGYDLIHAHWVGCGLVGLLPKRTLRMPILLTTRGTDVKLIGESDLWRRMFDFTVRRVDLIATVSEEHRRRIEERGVSRERVVMIPNGIDVHRFEKGDGKEARKGLGLPLKKRIALFVGNLIEIKGVDCLIDSVRIIKEKTDDFLLAMVGEGKLRGPLTGKVAAYGLTDSVRVVGIRPASEIPLWMNAADVLVLPSLSEGRPNVVLEAMACEVPIVATAVGGTPELVKDGEVGFLIPPKSPEAIAEKILLLLQDRQLRERLGRNGRRFILERGLTWDNCARRYSEIYRALIERSRGR